MLTHESNQNNLSDKEIPVITVEDQPKIESVYSLHENLALLKKRMESILDQLDPEIQILKNDSDNILPCNLFIDQKMKQAEETGLQIQNIERIINNSKQSKKTKI